MNSTLHVQLTATAEQVARLSALQAAFAQVCNALAPIVQKTRCWNRVALHHLAYRGLREEFPQMGSQMVCNAIYSVSRMCRIVLQHPDSPWNIARLGDRPLPLIQFLPGSPVYFDRHTLSLKDGRLSMYTLDGRMHFDINLRPEDEVRFHNEKLREILLGRTPHGFRLSFNFSATQDEEDAQPAADAQTSAELPEYLLVKASDSAGDIPPLPPSPARTRQVVAAMQ
jgi:hypothetical protein